MRSSSLSFKSKVNFLKSSGVGPWAKGYSFVSSVSSGRGCRIKRGGKDRLVVVVVVIVLVSTHCAISNCSLGAGPEISASSESSKLTVSFWLVLGRWTSVVFCTGDMPLRGGGGKPMADESYQRGMAGVGSRCRMALHSMRSRGVVFEIGLVLMIPGRRIVLRGRVVRRVMHAVDDDSQLDAYSKS